MLNRMLLSAALVFIISAGSASADYILVKINLNQLNFFPQAPLAIPGAGEAGAQPQPGVQPLPGGAAGMLGGAGGLQPPGGEQGGMPAIADPDAKWVSAFVEMKNVKRLGAGQFGEIWEFDHKWGRKNWLPVSAMFPMIGGRIVREPFTTEFHQNLTKEKKVTKDKNADKYVHLARQALSRGHLKEFHKAMKEAVELDPKNARVMNYLRVQKQLQAPLKIQDPAQVELIEELRSTGYKPNVSDQGHYCIYAQSFTADRYGEAVLKRRLIMMEETLESFFYWFAVQNGAPPQPAFPKHRLTGILCNSKEDFLNNHVKWGGVPMVADGFTPRRDNVVVMSAKPRLSDPRYVEFETLLTRRLLDANTKLQQFKLTLTREDLLSGRVNELKEAKYAHFFVAAAQTAILLSKALEDEAERATVTHEAVRQLIVASEMLPRNVQIPDWMIEGLAAMFETPVGSVYATTGTPSFSHLISFKHLQKTKKISDKSSDVLFNVVTDRYFQEARQLSAEAQDNRESETLRTRSMQAWEIARSTSWAFVYYLAQNRNLDYLFRYGKELDKLPRDMDLDGVILQSCFANAFDMKDPKDARRIERVRLTAMAASWFSLMQGTNLELMVMKLASGQQVNIETYLLDQRASLDGDTGAATGVISIQPAIPGAGNPRPPVVAPPIGDNPPGVNPLPPVVNPPPVVSPPPVNPPPMTNPAGTPPGGVKKRGPGGR